MKIKLSPIEITSALIILVAIFFRIFSLGNIPGVLGDEAWSAAQAQLMLKDLNYTWTVASGRLLSPFYIALAVASQGVEPFGIRYPAFVCGTLTVILSIPLLMKSYPKRTALIAALLIASLPIHILYSRLAWELCVGPIAGIFFVAFTLSKKWWWSLGSLIAATLVHPTFVNLTPALVLVYLNHLNDNGKLPDKKWLLLGTLFLIGLGLLALSWLPPGFPKPAYSFQSFYVFVLGVGAIFTGPVIFSTIADDLPFWLTYFLIGTFWMSLILLVIFQGKKLSRTEKAFFIGIFLSLPAIYLISGTYAVTPGLERASLFYCVPLCVLFAILLSHLRFGFLTGAIVSTGFLALTYAHGYLPIRETGGEKFTQYRTGPTDPKYAAAEWIVKNHKPFSRQVIVLAETYGIYWNLYNYLLGHIESEIVMLHGSSEPGMDPGFMITSSEDLISLLKSGGFVVGFSEGPLAELMKTLEEEGLKVSKKGFPLYSGKDHVILWSIP